MILFKTCLEYNTKKMKLQEFSQKKSAFYILRVQSKIIKDPGPIEMCQFCAILPEVMVIEKFFLRDAGNIKLVLSHFL